MFKLSVILSALALSCTPTAPATQPVEVVYNWGARLPNIESPTILTFVLPDNGEQAQLCAELGGVLISPVHCADVDY